jgi:hypothetical protein
MDSDGHVPTLGPEARIAAPPDPNFFLGFGDNDFVQLRFHEKRTLTKRIKWWLFCKVFPCRIVEWRDYVG